MNNNDDGVPIHPREQKLRELGQVCARMLDGVLGGIGFMLLVFDHGPRGFMTYVSNADRADGRRAMAEHLARTATFDERMAETLTEGEEIVLKGRRYRVDVVRRHRVQLVPLFNGDEIETSRTR